MLKHIEPSWNFGQPIISHAKIASDAVRYSDKVLLRKLATEDFADKVHRQLKPAKGEEYVHVIAVGAHEFYGPNRKGDTFEERVCQKYHDTFAKYARWYRNHIHHNPAKSYGVVKIAHYDKYKKRIDLIVALNADEHGVEKNGGLIADKELDKLFSHEPIPVSMSCLVSYDICSGCGHKARNVHERCTPRECVKYGGCADNLGKTFTDGHTLHVLNPDPVFFDISYVTVPADRIAFSLGIVRQPDIPLEKLSNDEAIDRFYKSHAELQKQAKATRTRKLTDSTLIDTIKKLSQLEHNTKPDKEQMLPFIKPASLVPYYFDVSDPISFVSRLYDNKQLLHPANFFASVYPALHGTIINNEIDVSSCFSDLRKQANLEELLLENPYFNCQHNSINYKEIELLNRIKPYTSLYPEDIAKRTTKAYFHLATKPMLKQASTVQNSKLASEYALYLLGGMLKNAYNWNQVLIANKSWSLE